MSNESKPLETWAIVELFGHNTVAGYISEQTIAGNAMLRIDVPEVGERPAYTKYYGATAVYGITPCDENAARIAANNLRTRPIELWIVPERKALPGSAEVDDPDLEYERGRDYDDVDDDDRPGF